ncbi:hypothetical protein BpHYR1_014780 [Brachionus plicatilis]|uniref:Uncharacterized protein n=1 Tax=Brachionus plicatilis TaxID=10195 RepID=A0A3M7RVP1_BRAPC|nr:hypothetical protein BpHYR1_014780 [Brachionus plicatilis]
MKQFPCSSESLERSIPDRKCKPSQFCETIWLTMFVLTNSKRAIIVHKPFGPREIKYQRENIFI